MITHLLLLLSLCATSVNTLNAADGGGSAGTDVELRLVTDTIQRSNCCTTLVLGRSEYQHTVDGINYTCVTMSPFDDLEAYQETKQQTHVGAMLLEKTVTAPARDAQTLGTLFVLIRDLTYEVSARKKHTESTSYGARGDNDGDTYIVGSGENPIHQLVHYPGMVVRRFTPTDWENQEVTRAIEKLRDEGFTWQEK